MTKTYSWTTPRGAKIEATITVEHITRKTISADGFPVEVKCNDWTRRVDTLTVNGKSTQLKEFWTEHGKRIGDPSTDCILIGRSGKDRILIALPNDVVEAVYGEERRDRKARTKRAEKVTAEYESQYNMTMNALNT